MVGNEGIEPPSRAPKARMRPLHQSPIFMVEPPGLEPGTSRYPESLQGGHSSIELQSHLVGLPGFEPGLAVLSL